MRVRGFSRSRAVFAAILPSLGLATLLVAGVAAAEAPAPVRTSPPAPVLIDLGLHLGGVYRIGGAPAFPITERAGASYGVSAYVEPSRRYSLGLGFEHTGLGHEQAAGDFGSAEIARDVNVLWGGLRVHFVQ